MAILQFPEDQYFIVKESAYLELGTVTPGNNMELEHIRLLMYKQGTIASNATIYLSVRSTAGIIVADSDVITLDTIPDFSAGNWYGKLRFDFNRQYISGSDTYTIGLITVNYTRNADVDYIAFGLDWPETVNSNGSVLAELYGYEG